MGDFSAIFLLKCFLVLVESVRISFVPIELERCLYVVVVAVLFYVHG